jgi:hypothetical protein
VLEAENLPIPNLETKPDEYDSYQCSLSATFKEIAKEELREDEQLRSQALSQFREWIAKHPNIKRCRTGRWMSDFALICSLTWSAFRRAISAPLPENEEIFRDGRL